MIRLIYNLLWPVGLIFFLPRYLLKMVRRGGYREKFGQRLGVYDAKVRDRLAGKKGIWLHAVSVGEVRIALKLAVTLGELQRNLHCVLTTTTTTGFAVASQNAPDWVEVIYNPLDFWPIMRRAFSVINPAKIVLIEAEVWPNLVAEAHRRKIPIVLANARLSARSETRFRRFRWLVAPIFRRLDLICVPETGDVERWTALGVARQKIHCTGSIKFDSENVSIDPAIPKGILTELGIAHRTIIVAGSTHSGEEKILAEVYRALRRQFVDLLLVIAPRHIERTNEIGHLLLEKGFRVALRSHPLPSDRGADCLIVDSTGELRNWYATATVVFVGKSLCAHGGQNPVEAIEAGRPVLFGPNMENFAALTKALLERNAAIQINSPTELRRELAALLGDPERREELVKNARAVLETHRGATALTARLIKDLG